MIFIDMKKNTITLTEQQLIEIIYNAINNYINDCNNNISNLKIDGDIPDLRDTIGSYADEFFLKRHLKEGLVRTFPCENVTNMLCRKFSLQKNQVQNETRNFNGADITLLTVVLPHNVSSSVLGEIKHFMRTCGIRRKALTLKKNVLILIVVLRSTPNNIIM